MTTSQDVIDDTIVLVGEQPGVTVIPARGSLTRLNYFDGKFLRSDDLRLEQDYVRALAAISNQAGGAGVVHGFDATLATGGDDVLVLGPGLAISPSGRPLVLTQQVALDLQQIIDRSSRVVTARLAAEGGSDQFADCVTAAATPTSGVEVAQGAQFWVVAIGPAEALCGHEDVLGRLCEEACVTATDRPYRLEGLVVVAVPLRLTVGVATSTAVSLGAVHQRSLIASAAFATERLTATDLRSRAGLAAQTWCLGARLPGGDDLVPVALVARAGTTTLFLDAWTVRRERIETPPRRYWAPPMGLRPLDVFLAQVLQFQCQLRDGLGSTDDPGANEDPCRTQQSALDEAAQYLGEIAERFVGSGEEFVEATAGPRRTLPPFPGGESRLGDVRHRLLLALRQIRGGASSQVLIDRGIVELPPAGFLPVVPGTTQTADAQVRALMGPGVDLRFCVTRPDVVGHELEEAQHLDRISLLAGLDDPAQRAQVDVLVPDGELVETADPAAGLSFDMTLQLAPSFVAAVGQRVTEGAPLLRAFLAEAPTASTAAIHGAARADALSTGGGAFRFAGVSELARGAKGSDFVRGLAELEPAGGAGAEVIRDLNVMRGVDLSARRADPVFAMRMRALGAEARSINAMRRAGGGVDEGDEPAPVFDTPTEGDVVSVWLDLTCDADPFSLGAGESTPVRAVADISTPTKQPTVLRHELRGDLQIEDVVPVPNGGRRVSGRLRGLGFRDGVVEGDAAGRQSGSFDFPFTLTRAPDDDGNPTVELRVAITDDVAVRIAGVGSGRPLTIQVVAAQTTTAGRVFSLAIARLREDPSVADPANVVQRLARSALELLGVGLGDPSFASASGLLLFPPPGAPAGGTTVRATRDWVLFHRRRTITCAGDERPERPPVAPARLELYGLALRDREPLAAAIAALLSDDSAAISRLGLQDVGRIEFAGDTADLTTRVADIQADWRATSPGESLLFAGIGMDTAAADDPALVRKRLLRVVDVVTPISAPASDMRSDVLPGVPAALVVPGTDGVIVLASLLQRTTTCQTAFRVRDEVRDRYFEVLSAGNANEALKIAMEGGADELARVTFPTGEATPDDGVDALRNAWSQFPNQLQTVSVFSRPGDPDAGDQALREARGGKMANAVGQGPSVAAFEVDVQLPGDCPAVALFVPPAVVLPSLTCHQVVLLDPAAVEEFRAAGEPDAVLKLAVKRGKRLGQVRFTVGTDGIVDQDVEPLRERFAAVGVERIAEAVVLSKLGDAAAGDVVTRKARAKAILVNLDQDVEVELSEPKGLAFDCPAITLLIPELG